MSVVKFKLNLIKYEAEGMGGPGGAAKQEYDVRDIIHKIVLHPTQKHKGFRFYTVAKVADKIKKCKEDSIVLEKADYDIVKSAFEQFEGFGANDVELVNRIFDAEEIK